MKDLRKVIEKVGPEGFCCTLLLDPLDAFNVFFFFKPSKVQSEFCMYMQVTGIPPEAQELRANGDLIDSSSLIQFYVGAEAKSDVTK